MLEAMTNDRERSLTKITAVTLGFSIIKILCTTLGETGGDSVSMTWLGETTPEAGKSGLSGYLVGTLLFGVVLAVLAVGQIRARRFNPWLYWPTIVASTKPAPRWSTCARGHWASVIPEARFCSSPVSCSRSSSGAER